ncbi:DUF4097 family beta strand repeat-containing protein [Methanoculleus sp.]|uniref:DUF4097 family beta strand repeat-containing protein n=1 Tax=Methanoculleus sp. TaxID=90427 RepID=UPI0025DBDD72|nr:DUF4097 family beta strand repeat-containing protein [Methanoculleus sp.]
MQKTGYAALALLVLIAAVTPGCTGVPGLEETEEFNRTVTVEPASGVVVINRNGGVNVNAWNEEHVAITAVKRTTYGRGEFEKVRIEVTEGDPLRIETVHTGVNPRVGVDYTIQLPPTVVLQRVESSNGPIDLSGVRGNGTELRASNGPVLVDGAPGGDLAAASSNGRVEMRGVEGYVTATTSNGAVTLRLAEDLDARVVATTSNGRIAVNDLPLLLSESSGTSVSGTLGDGGPTITVTTSNGNIDLSGL